MPIYSIAQKNIVAIKVAVVVFIQYNTANTPDNDFMNFPFKKYNYHT